MPDDLEPLEEVAEGEIVDEHAGPFILVYWRHHALREWDGFPSVADAVKMAHAIEEDSAGVARFVAEGDTIVGWFDDPDPTSLWYRASIFTYDRAGTEAEWREDFEHPVPPD